MRIKDRLRRRLKGLHRNPVEFKSIRTLLNLAVSRPVDLLKMEKVIADLPGSPSEVASLIEAALSKMKANQKVQPECCNLVAATIRSLENIDINIAMDFGMRTMPVWPDKRGMTTLVSMLEREGRQHHALDILDHASDEKWARHKRDTIKSAIGLLGMDDRPLAERAEKAYLSHVGMNHLKQDPAPAVILYGDVDMNTIDGSSVWLSSLVEAFSGTGFEVHVLLKSNISRELLVGHLQGFDGVKLLEPHLFGLPDEELTTSQAVDLIEILDGIHGGYRCIVLRGMDLCVKAGAKKSLWKRIWAYLTDYYQVDEVDGRMISKDNRILLNDLQHVFEYFLVQTEEIGKSLEELGIESSMLRLLPPMIPDRMITIEPTENGGSPDALKIGYCGKIAPMWGVRELIEKVEELNSAERPIEVHVIGDKIHRSSEHHPRFREEMTQLLRESPVVKWHGAMERDAAVMMLASLDIGWCYRNVSLEHHTLELSTKLLEHLAINLPFIVTRNKVNEALLGSEYPFFVDDENEMEGMLTRIVNDGIGKIELVDKVRPHLISSVRADILLPMLMEGFQRQMRPHRIVIAGNDLKFVGQFESHLKRLGCMVKRDIWEWGEPQFIQRSKALLEWAEFVWCEWSLANAVWYSNNLRDDQQMVTRLHLQEVGERARKFQLDIDMDKVNKVIIVAEHVRQEAIKLFGWDSNKLVFIPNFIESARLKNESKDTSNKRIGIIGIVPKRKRLDLALDLLEKLREKDDEWSLVIKGKVPKDYPWMFGLSRRKEMEYYDEQYKRIETSEKLKGAVKFEGYTLTISEFFTKIGYVVSPSDFESFHYTIADGVSSGNFPVIWPWEGADELYPEEWVIKGVEDAANVMIEYSQSTEEERLAGAEDRFEVVRSRYDIEEVFPQLVETLIGEWR